MTQQFQQILNKNGVKQNVFRYTKPALPFLVSQIRRLVNQNFGNCAIIWK